MKKFFEGFTTIEALKKEYRRLSKIYHTDNIFTGDEAVFKAINNEYSDKYIILKKQEELNKREEYGYNNENFEFTKEQNTKFAKEAENYINIILELFKYGDKIKIEIIGSWLWVSGETKEIKDDLKTLGFNWSVKKKTWYYTDGFKGKKKHYKSNYATMDDIRQKYGSTTYKNNDKSKLA